jgi:hypothetical protein
MSRRQVALGGCAGLVFALGVLVGGQRPIPRAGAGDAPEGKKRSPKEAAAEAEKDARGVNLALANRFHLRLEKVCRGSGLGFAYVGPLAWAPKPHGGGIPVDFPESYCQWVVTEAKNLPPVRVLFRLTASATKRGTPAGSYTCDDETLYLYLVPGEAYLKAEDALPVKNRDPADPPVTVVEFMKAI